MLQQLATENIATAAATGGGLGLLVTGLLLGIRHGFDWDHIAAITDITATADVGTEAHELRSQTVGLVHDHGHGDPDEPRAPDRGQEAAAARFAPALAPSLAPALAASPALDRSRTLAEQRHAIALGTLYALGHGVVVAVLGLTAIAFGAILPEWIDPIMGRVVGLTLLALGAWVFFSLYQYARHGTEFRLRSRWMLVLDGVRYAWRRFQARVRGHAHIDAIETSSYGPKTALGVGMIHGIGAETGSQVLIIAAVGGAAGQGLGVPMILAFIVGLLIANSLIVVATATGFVASRFRQRLYLVVGVLAGTFSLVVGSLFLVEAEAVLPDLERILSFIGA
jgi:high-affinity nickel-transport protein